MRNSHSYVLSSLLVLVILIVWEIGAVLYNKSFILPTPTAIAGELWELKTVLLLNHLPPTLLVIVIGLIISIVLGVSLAVWMNMSKTVEKTFYPLIITSQTIPVIALAPIFVLWFGYTIWSKVVVAILITFFRLQSVHLMGSVHPIKI